MKTVVSCVPKYSILNPHCSFCFLLMPYAMILSATHHVHECIWVKYQSLTKVVFLLGGTEQVIRILQQWQQNASRCNSSSNADLPSAFKKKGFRISDNLGSGNCMFYALSEQLEIVKGVKIHHFELRQYLVQYLREHPKLVSIW